MKVLFTCLLLLVSFLSTNLTYADYQYDPSGNLTSDDVYHYNYNDAGRVKSIQLGSDTGQTIAQYFYDHTGQRIKKIENGKTCHYISKLFQSCDGKNSKFHFLQGNRIAAIHEDGTEQLFHNDHIGSPIAVSDKDGTVIERITYKPFGQSTSSSTSSLTSQYTFSGKEKDTNGSQYFEARSYLPHLAVFNRIDPVLPVIGNSLSLNPYQYAYNNPLRYTDKTGEIPVDTVADVGFIIYDIGSGIYNLATGDFESAKVDGLALTADVGGFFIPYATGLGVAVRGANQVHKVIPAKAIRVLESIKKGGGQAPHGYKGRKTFDNDGREGGQRLKQFDTKGKEITYTGYDVNPKVKGVKRDNERIVVGSDGRSYYTDNHYQSFIEIR